MKDVTVTTTVSVPDESEPIEEVPVIPRAAQIVIDIAKAVSDAGLDHSFDVVFKAAVQAAFRDRNKFDW